MVASQVYKSDSEGKHKETPLGNSLLSFSYSLVNLIIKKYARYLRFQDFQRELRSPSQHLHVYTYGNSALGGGTITHK